LKKAVKYFPNYSTAFTILGETYLAAQQYEDSANAFEKSLAINPYNDMVYSALIGEYEAQGRVAEAEAVQGRLRILNGDTSGEIVN
ncbi:MAG: tetratricopeptide repeat protein, partial [Proteobacteria bacterium]|nr:tetratricopeptide repeat protein [Pseudomonadota bacterium]